MVTRKFQVIIMMFIMCITASRDAWADVNLWHDKWDVLADQPGVEITTGQNTNGDETRDILLPGKVSIHETRHDDKIERVEQDISGHGAVMCVWGIYTALRSVFDLCPTNSGDEELKTALDDAINRIDDFILANSNAGVTKEGLQAQVRKQMLAAQEKLNGLPDDVRAQKCYAGDAAKMLDRLRSKPTDSIKRSVDDLLSVPRPPVINPCL